MRTKLSFNVMQLSEWHRDELHVFLTYLLPCLERFGYVFLRAELQEEDVTDNALSIDDVFTRPAARKL
jgi:hypothetical protein